MGSGAALRGPGSLVDCAAMSDDCALSGTMHATASEALQALERAFSKAHVFLTEAHQLGGLALVVHWDMEGDHRQLLVDALLEALPSLSMGAEELKPVSDDEPDSLEG